MDSMDGMLDALQPGADDELRLDGARAGRRRRVQKHETDYSCRCVIVKLTGRMPEMTVGQSQLSRLAVL